MWGVKIARLFFVVVDSSDVDSSVWGFGSGLLVFCLSVQAQSS